MKNNFSASLGFATICFFATTGASGLSAQGPGGPGGGFGRGFDGRGPMGPRGGQRTVVGAPYSAVETRSFQQTLSDGNVINRTTTTKQYRDGQGRTRVEETVTPPANSGRQPFTRISIEDPVAGVRHELDSSSMTVHSTPIHKIGTGPNRPPVGNAQTTGTATRQGRDGSMVVRAELGTQMLNGVSAVGRRETETIPAGRVGNAAPLTVERETWISMELKMPIRIKVTDPQHGTSTTELTNVIQGEPDSSLFTVPAGYAEKSVPRGGRGRGRGPGQWTSGTQSGTTAQQ